MLRVDEMKLIDLDDIKVAFASAGGLGNWLLEIDTILKVSISAASLLYIILKIRNLIKDKE
jgi:hypothetical protein